MSHPDYEVYETLSYSDRKQAASKDCYDKYADDVAHDPRHEDDGDLYEAALKAVAEADDYEKYQVYEGYTPKGCYPNSYFL